MTTAFGTVLTNTFGKKKVKYLEKPMDIFPKTEAEKKQEAREEKRKLINWLNGWKKLSAKKKDTGSESDGKP